MTDDGPNIGLIASGLVLTLIAAVAAWSLMSWLSKPTNFDVRMSELAKQVSRSETLAASAGALDSHPAHAVCPGLRPEDLDRLRASVGAAAVRAGLPAPSLTFSAAEATQTASMAPVKLNLQATGGYEAMLGLISQLERSEPEIFVDSLDLRTSAATVDLKLSGKVFCWTSAH